MKKLVAVLCLLALCLPLISCSSSLATEETEEETSTVTAEEKVTEEEKETGPIVYPEGFSVGYAIGDITTTPLPMYEATAETVHDPLMLTCTAICDGENVALIMCADLKGMQRNIAEKSMELIEKKFGIPGENVMINCTHTHSAPTVGGESAELTRWMTYYYKQLPAIVEEALRDLDVVEGAYTGKGSAESIAFVRRYLMPDGTYKTHGNSTALGHETEADNELRTIRFDRKNKKDVLMVNFQTHYGGATGLYPAQLSADFVMPFREAAEKELDCLFIYNSGAGGNINFNSPIPGEKIYPTFPDTIPAFMEATREALAAEEVAQVGRIQTAESVVSATVRKHSEERLAQAKEIQAAGYESDMGRSLISKYGFYSKHEASAVIRNAGLGETEDVPFSAIAFGDIAFTAFPYEMFDTNGKEVREASPYKMTFICSLTNGTYGYVPSAFAYPHGSYEVVVTRFTEGHGEIFAQEMVRLLNLCKEAA